MIDARGFRTRMSKGETMKALKWIACMFVLTGTLSLTGCGGGEADTGSEAGGDAAAESGSDTKPAEGEGGSDSK